MYIGKDVKITFVVTICIVDDIKLNQFTSKFFPHQGVQKI
jgi:hypothetical protein